MRGILLICATVCTLSPERLAAQDRQVISVPEAAIIFDAWNRSLNQMIGDNPLYTYGDVSGIENDNIRLSQGRITVDLDLDSLKSAEAVIAKMLQDNQFQQELRNNPNFADAFYDAPLASSVIAADLMRQYSAAAGRPPSQQQYCMPPIWGCSLPVNLPQ